MNHDFFPVVAEFKGEYAFLSNFYPAPIIWAGMSWPTSEHAYQAAKSVDMQVRERIAALPTPGAAKRAGKTIMLRDDWESIKFEIMYDIVEAKFKQHADLREKLLATGDAYLEEGNVWKDTTWGVCPPRSGRGRNWLGHILMDIRDTL